MTMKPRDDLSQEDTKELFYHQVSSRGLMKVMEHPEELSWSPQSLNLDLTTHHRLIEQNQIQNLTP